MLASRVTDAVEFRDRLAPFLTETLGNLRQKINPDLPDLRSRPAEWFRTWDQVRNRMILSYLKEGTTRDVLQVTLTRLRTTSSRAFGTITFFVSLFLDVFTFRRTRRLFTVIVSFLCACDLTMPCTAASFCASICAWFNNV